MLSTDDTIVAVATPPGRGGIGVVRLSGSDAPRIASTLIGPRPLRPRVATFARLCVADDRRGGALDHVVVTYFPAPRSYTAEDVVEISAHGSPVVLQEIVRAAMRAGARLAERGEFTLRAYVNGRMDLVQAEAVADLIEAASPLQAQLAFDQLDGTLTGLLTRLEGQIFDLIARLEASIDFPDEGYRFIEASEVGSTLAALVAELEGLIARGRVGRIIREGRRVAILGRPNAGKSSLFNQLVGASRAIVAETAGTTRDLLTERVTMGGVVLTLVDTAGVRDGGDPVEREGVSRAAQAAATADVKVVVLDRSCPVGPEDRALVGQQPSAETVRVVNKIDLPAAWHPEAYGAAEPWVEVSARTGEGMAALRAAILDRVLGEEPRREEVAVTNQRHVAMLQRCLAAVNRARDAAAQRSPEEFVLADLHEALEALAALRGKRTAEDVLQEIFGRFCVGK